MIDPRELRIDNYVEYNGNIYQMRVVSKDDEPILDTIEFGPGVVSYKDLNPIPLTEQHLIDFGAIQEYGSYNKYYLHKMKFDFNKEGVCRFHWSGKVTYIEYLHKLQNIVRDLSGIELTKSGK